MGGMARTATGDLREYLVPYLYNAKLCLVILSTAARFDQDITS